MIHIGSVIKNHAGIRVPLGIGLCICALPAVAAGESTGQTADSSTDVVIYGATPAGISAAIAVAREGGSAVVLEPSRWIGGMITGGLACTDVGQAAVIGGIAREFFERAARAPGTPMWYAEPKVNMDTFRAMLREAKVPVFTKKRMESVGRDGDRIATLTTADGSTYRGRVFVDASYEGDLMAAAGVSYMVGREGTDVHGESLAGFRPAPLRPRSREVMCQDSPSIGGPKHAMSYVHGTPTKISARNKDGALLPGICDSWLEPGSGDRRIQAYNFRVIVTRRPDNRVPFPKPPRYDPARYELLARIIDAYPGIRFSKLVYLGPIAGEKYDLNAVGLVMSTDHVGANYGYPEGDAATRTRIHQDHLDYVQGLLWFLANDPRVPADLRQQASEWGLARDEFTDNDYWPYALYVREARRMQGAYVMREQDCRQELTKPDAIGMGSFILDSHAVQRLVDQEGNVIDEGNFDVPVRPYQIPYRCIVPRKEQCVNLLVPVCLSASHVAYGSLRMEPQFMILGQAAGTAAVRALRAKRPVQDVDIPSLQESLRRARQILELPAPAKAAAASTMPGLLLGDDQAVLTGEWQMSSFGDPIDHFSRHDLNNDKGEKAARFELSVPKPGRYEVRLAYVAADNRASNVPVTIEHVNGRTTIQVNQKRRPPLDGHFVSLGVFEFSPGKRVAINVENRATDGYVSIDAVQLLPEPRK